MRARGWTIFAATMIVAFGLVAQPTRAGAVASWSVASSPNAPANTVVISGVSCASSSMCVAVGNANSGTTQLPVARLWNGSSWSVLPVPSVSGAFATALFGVACPTVALCFAVGASTGQTARKVIERWNGSTWSIVSSPTLSSTFESLSNVSCATISNCFAVGSYDNGSGVVPLGLHWNGSTWSLSSTITPAQTPAYL